LSVAATVNGLAVPAAYAARDRTRARACIAPPGLESDSIRYTGDVKTLSVTEFARNISAVLDELERDQEEIVLVRNSRHVARLVPEAPRRDALSVFGDLYRTIDDETADGVSAALAARRKGRRGRVSELRDPWAG
jgi:prevent-host-death family protein